MFTTKTVINELGLKENL